jgi:2-amino-4-hydroxy-6-hydroxymethyldihydropteridine diphosphokinase
LNHDSGREGAPAFVALGSNLGDRLRTLRRAVADLEVEGVGVRRRSSIYETDPMGPPQPPYLNAVVELITTLDPRRLLVILKAIENMAGRKERERWGPRELDLDLLLHGDARETGPDLILPHPGICQRPFVLVPLAEIAPRLELPGAGRTAEEVLAAVGSAGVRLFASGWNPEGVEATRCKS